MLSIRFLFVAEGSSDAGLLKHLEELVVQAGADEASGVCPNLSMLPNPPGKRVRDQVEAALRFEPAPDLVFVHRDADRVTVEQRCKEIEAELEAISLSVKWVAVVPVRELEAWMLLDEAAIRKAAGNPSGKKSLALPSPLDVEAVREPKVALARALRQAAGVKTQRKRRQVDREMSALSHDVLASSDLCRVARDVPAWFSLVQRTATAVRAVAASR